MSIPTQMSLVGFIASAPELLFTKAGAECCRMRVGVEQWRKEVDGSFTKLDPTFHDKGYTQAQIALTGAEGLIPDSAAQYQVKLEWWLHDGEWQLARLDWE